jgi:hypothetical protein
MIARDVEVLDLHPVSWNNLMSLVDLSKADDIRPSQPNILSLLHHGGKMARVYAPAGFRVPTIEQVDDPQELAKKLYYQLPGLDGVQILERDSLTLFSDRIQKMDWQTNDIEDFPLRALRLAEEDPAGLSFFPAFSWTWNGFSLEGVRAWMSAGPNPCALFLGIVRDGAPWATLIIRWADGKVRLITTLEHLAPFGLSAEKLPSSPQDLATICEVIHARVAPIRAALICEYAVFTRILSSEEKQKELTLAVAAGTATSFGLGE